jgi:hypothetical protein
MLEYKTQVIKSVIEAYNKIDEIQNIGLINGKMGLCINLYHTAKYIRDDDLMMKADDIFDFVQSKIKLSLPIHFSDGLTGIGWGIQHLISESFVSGEPNVILVDIDNLESEVTKYFPVSLYRFSNGFIGQMIYVIKRLIYNRKANDSIEILQLKVTLTSMIEKLDIIVENEDSLFFAPEQPTMYWDIPVIAWILVELKRTELYRSRVDKLVHTFSSKLQKINIKTYAHALMLRYTLLLLSSIDILAENKKTEDSFVANPDENYLIVLCYYLLSQIDSAYKVQYNMWKEKLFKEFNIPKEVFFDGFMGFYRLLY